MLSVLNSMSENLSIENTLDERISIIFMSISDINVRVRFARKIGELFEIMIIKNKASCTAHTLALLNMFHNILGCTMDIQYTAIANYIKETVIKHSASAEVCEIGGKLDQPDGEYIAGTIMPVANSILEYLSGDKSDLCSIARIYSSYNYSQIRELCNTIIIGLKKQ